MPNEDIYLPIHVGKSCGEDLGFIGDDTGLNISHKNKNYCELTALYWAWKNLKCEYIGLCHYRRYFAHPIINYDLENKKNSLYNEKDFNNLLAKYDVVLPTYSVLKGYTVRTRYEYGHKKRDLDEVEKIINEFYPEYIKSFEYVMNQNKVYFCNMFVMRKDFADSYCEWLFSILFELEKRVDISNYDQYQARVFGFLSERLFNVWLYHNKLNVAMVKTVFLEDSNEGNLVKKILRYVYYKFYEIIQ